MLNNRSIIFDYLFTLHFKIFFPNDITIHYYLYMRFVMNGCGLKKIYYNSCIYYINVWNTVSHSPVATIRGILLTDKILLETYIRLRSIL